MAIIQFPGTDFHDLNLDWILSQVKNLLAEWAETKGEWENIVESNDDFVATVTDEWNDFQEYVTNYLANLPLTEEVSAKIDAMVADGTLLNLITADEGDGSALSDVAGQWLAAHITQETGYVIDDSLTVPGAAADAKATGDAITDLRGAVDEIVTVTSSANLLNPNHITVGKFWKTTAVDGRSIMEQADNSAYSCAYIDVTAGQSYVVTGISYNAYNADAEGYATGIAYTTSGSVATPVLDTSAINAQYGNTDKTTTRVYFSWRHATYETDTFMANVGTSILPYVPYSEPTLVLGEDVNVPYDQIVDIPEPNEYTVDINGGGDFTSIVECFNTIKDIEDHKTVYIMPGTYDIYEELGGYDYVSAIDKTTETMYTVQPWLDNISIIGRGNVVLTMDIDASIDSDIVWMLSPLNVRGNFHIENLTIIAGNSRYAIHDESGVDYPNTTHEYENIRAIKTGSAQAVGCGYSQNSIVKIRNCYFESANSFAYSYHTKGRIMFTAENTVFKTATSTLSYSALRLSQEGDIVGGVALTGHAKISNCYFETNNGVKPIRINKENQGQGVGVNVTDIELINCNVSEILNYYKTSQAKAIAYNTIAGTKTVLVDITE